jgi:hypothetical protein
MAKGRKPRLGQLSVRVPVEVHQQLLDIAAVLGTDVSAVVNQLIAEGLPSLHTKATELAKRQKAAREDFQAVTYTLPDTPGGEYLVKLAMDAGRPIESQEKQWEAMVSTVMTNMPQASKATVVSLVISALEELRREEEQRQVEQAVEQMMGELTGDEEELP